MSKITAHRNGKVSRDGEVIGSVKRRVYEATPRRYRSEYVALDTSGVIVAIQTTKALAISALASRVAA